MLRFVVFNYLSLFLLPLLLLPTSHRNIPCQQIPCCLRVVYTENVWGSVTLRRWDYSSAFHSELWATADINLYTAVGSSAGANARVKVWKKLSASQACPHWTWVCPHGHDGKYSEFLLKNSPSISTFHIFGKKKLFKRPFYDIGILGEGQRMRKGFAFGDREIMSPL